VAKSFLAAVREVLAVRFENLTMLTRRFAITVAVLFDARATCVAVPLLEERCLWVHLVGRVTALNALPVAIGTRG